MAAGASLPIVPATFAQCSGPYPPPSGRTHSLLPPRLSHRPTEGGDWRGGGIPAQSSHDRSCCLGLELKLAGKRGVEFFM